MMHIGKYCLPFALALLAVVCRAEDLNLTFSPDSSRVAFTRDNDLWIRNLSDSVETRITSDGTDVVMNGYASWVYYEEIFGRSCRYKAFWWSPDSKKLAFYRFDDSKVTMFPIFSPFGQDGTLKQTRYPKAGETNPGVRIGIADCRADGCSVIWADFEDDSEQYFGTPFWGDDSKNLYVQREPRRQSQLDLYEVNVADGSKRSIYHEEYPTWIELIDGMLFDSRGLYMVRDFESGWQQIYYLSYDGSVRRLTDGRNWNVELLRLDKKSGALWFKARRDSRLHPSIYRLDRNGRISLLTDPDFWVDSVTFSEDGKSFVARESNARNPWRKVRYSAVSKEAKALETVEAPVELSEECPMPQILRIENEGFDLYGVITYPRGFNPSKKYPVIMEVYGGPGTAYVRDYWKSRDASNRWCWENGIIWMCVDPRTSGENGRRGMDQAFRRMTVIELQDYIAWAKYMQAQPYVDGGKIGVDGFSFGGTTTSMLVLRYPQYFSCGIAGGGVYDWTLYDSVYTERFMDTPQANPDGYDEASVLHHVGCGISSDYKPGSLKLTHGTGDDNVHFQNTLMLVDALQRKGILFDLMIYPDGMHGYRGAQHEHDVQDAASFWKARLLDAGL